MVIVKVEGNSVKDNVEYLKYNGYGRAVFRLREDVYIGLFGSKKYLELGDVEVVKVYNSMLSDYATQSELDYLADIGN